MNTCRPRMPKTVKKKTHKQDDVGDHRHGSDDCADQACASREHGERPERTQNAAHAQGRRRSPPSRRERLTRLTTTTTKSITFHPSSQVGVSSKYTPLAIILTSISDGEHGGEHAPRCSRPTFSRRRLDGVGTPAKRPSIFSGSIWQSTIAFAMMKSRMTLSNHGFSLIRTCSDARHGRAQTTRRRIRKNAAVEPGRRLGLLIVQGVHVRELLVRLVGAKRGGREGDEGGRRQVRERRARSASFFSRARRA